MLDGLIKMPCFVDEENHPGCATCGLSCDCWRITMLAILRPQVITRPFLCEAADDDGAGERGEPHSVLENAFGTDDDRPPCKLTPHDKDEILTNVYLVWLLKQP